MSLAQPTTRPGLTIYQKFTFAAAVLADLAARGDNETLDTRLILAVWLLPIVAMFLGLAAIPVSSLVLAAFAARCVWRLYAQSGAAAIRGGPNWLAAMPRLRSLRLRGR